MQTDEFPAPLGSGREGRIRAEYRALKKRWDYRNSGLPALWLYLARKHRMPVQEVKRIAKPTSHSGSSQPSPVSTKSS